MKTKLRAEIITETTREITFRVERRTEASLVKENCEKCFAKLLTINEAVEVSGLVWDEIVCLIKNKEIDFFESKNGEVFVCSQSILGFKK